MSLVIDKNRCSQNHKCPLVEMCLVEAITQSEMCLPEIDTEKCIECGKCINLCGMGAIYKEN